MVDLASRALARLIEGKSPEEIREAFNLPDDLTEEEKLEPIKNICEDPRIRLLNRLYAKKRKVQLCTCMHILTVCAWSYHHGQNRTNKNTAGWLLPDYYGLECVWLVLRDVAGMASM